MAIIELKMPKMGESISEATILNWLKNVGDIVEEDETILEVATDKVDSEVPSPCAGVISEILFQPNEVVEVGKVIAIISEDTTQGAKKTISQEDVSVTKENLSVKNKEISISNPKGEYTIQK